MRALLTDLYELTMASSYLRRGITGSATFSLYVRDLPPERGFLVAAGLEEAMSYLEDLSFTDEDLTYLREELELSEADVEALRGLRFEGDVWAPPEGRVLFAGEPLLEVTAPIAQGQIAETYLLNQITVNTLLATKAARFVIAAGGRDLVDFSFRRAHGLDAAMAVARASALVGFAATSNVEAARRLGVRAAGTMAHSYVEVFGREREAFRAFAEDFPSRATFLVDTYDTPSGVRAAIAVIREMDLGAGAAIRLDSGDLSQLSVQAREMLDRAGLPGVRIFASGGIDEVDIERLVASGAPIDAFGVGTRLGVSADAPYLDTVYKLVSFEGRPMLKLSPGKATYPGEKQVFRSPGFEGDVIALRDEEGMEGDPLLGQVMSAGTRTRPPEPLEAVRARFLEDLAALPAEAKGLVSPEPVPVRFSDGLRALADRARRDVSADLLDSG
jgi:nicotinate phosphoribosyltransferase